MLDTACSRNVWSAAGRSASKEPQHLLAGPSDSAGPANATRKAVSHTGLSTSATTPTTLAVFDRTMAIDVLTNEVKWTYEGEENRHSRGLLTPRGVLLMGRGAIQTDVFGLAPTYYPRGFLGGNENRGYVALPE